MWIQEGIMKYVYSVARFLHIIDEDNQLDITDLSFMLVMYKIMVTPNVDWPSLCALIPVILNKMHRRHINAQQLDSQ